MAGWLDGWMDGWMDGVWINITIHPCNFFSTFAKKLPIFAFFHPFQAIFPLFQAFWQDEPFEMPVLGKSEADSC